MTKISRISYLKYFFFSFVFVFVANIFLNHDFTMFLGVMYGDINSNIILDGTLFVKMFLVLFGETGVLSAGFYYLTKALF